MTRPVDRASPLLLVADDEPELCALLDITQQIARSVPDRVERTAAPRAAQLGRWRFPDQSDWWSRRGPVPAAQRMKHSGRTMQRA